MAITYPISLPSAFAAARITLRQCNTVGESVSPFSAEQQIYVHQGQWWEAEITLPRMSRDNAEDVGAALLSLRGKEGSFLMGDPSAATPRGSAGGTPLVDGAGQTGLTLAVKGLPLSTANWLKAGDYIQLGSGSTSRLHKVLAAVTSSGAGKATLDIWPRLRSSPADGAAVVVSGAKGLWMLSSNKLEWDIEPAMIYGFSIACRERLG